MSQTQSEKTFEHLELEHAALVILRQNPEVRTEKAFREVLLATLEKEFFYSKEKLEWTERMLDGGEIKLPKLR